MPTSDMTAFLNAQNAIRLALSDAFRACADIAQTTGEPSDAMSSEAFDAMAPFIGPQPHILTMFATAEAQFSDDMRERIVQISALYPLAADAMRLMALGNSSDNNTK